MSDVGRELNWQDQVIRDLEAKVARYEVALTYLASPTCGWHGRGDIRDWVEGECPEEMVRAALSTCIWLAGATVK